MTELAPRYQHYEVLRRSDGSPWELGRGAMGITYKAFDVNLCCEVALKVVNAALVESPEVRERFVREARAAAALRHRNVASVFHLGNNAEHFFYAMEFIEGETLDAHVRRAGPLSAGDTLRVMLQVSRALGAAARQGLVHRDIKPANLMVTQEPAEEESVVKVIDFGLARPVTSANEVAPLTIGGFVGTPQYASPEQLEEKPLDARSDIYSLGITAWFLLTGRAPFTGSLASVCQQQLTKTPPVEQLPAAVPDSLRGLLLRMLEKRLLARPQTATELRLEIERCLQAADLAELGGTQVLRLPTLDMAPAASVLPEAAQCFKPGTRLNGRYRVVSILADDTVGALYQAMDESSGHAPVALRVLPEGLTPAAETSLQEDIRLAQTAQQPHLVSRLAVERSSSPKAAFVVEEWLNGFTLRDMLAARRGAIQIAEALEILIQAADASDRAMQYRIGPLDLALHSLHVHFPSLPLLTPDQFRAGELVGQSALSWPEWLLKIRVAHPEAFARQQHTWMGGATLVPAGGLSATDLAGNLAEGQLVRTLAWLVYELLGGRTSSQQSRPGSILSGRYSALTTLDEAANAVLRDVLLGQTTFSTARAFSTALADAVRSGASRRPAVFPPPRPEAVSSLRADSAATTTIEGGRAPLSVRNEAADPTPRGLPRRDPRHVEVEAEAGSAWQRLSAGDQPRSNPGRWLLGIVGTVALFCLAFVTAMVVFWYQPARRTHPHGTTASTRAHDVLPKSTPIPAATQTPLPSPAFVRNEAPALLNKAPTEANSSSPPATLTPSGNRFTKMPPIIDGDLPEVGSPPPLVPTVAASPTNPPERMVEVKLDSIPAGAQIRADGRVLGTTPLETFLPVGDHQLIAHYQDWPETRQTVHLDRSKPSVAAQIRLMRPELVPGAVVQPSSNRRDPDQRIRAFFERRGTRDASSNPPPKSTATNPTPSSTAESQPEVRPALRVLTPFRLDDAGAGSATSSQTAHPSPSQDGSEDGN